MYKVIERTFLLALGAIIFIALGYLMSPILLFYINNYTNIFLVTGFTVMGILFSAVIQFYINYTRSKEAVNMRNENTALITHEMRTSLTSTSWAITYILNNYSSDIKKYDIKMLENIIKSIHTTIMHTVNLLDTSLVDIGKLSISLQWVNLSEVEDMIKEIIEKYKMGIEGQNIKFISSIKLDHELNMEVDFLRLRIIIENLLENSIQYVSGENKIIEIKVNNTDKRLNLIVRDNGIGIPKKEQDKIFGEFYRASNARRKMTNGSGIGLYMCKQYIKSYNGTIDFESRENEGTTFNISLPLNTSADVNEFLKQV